MTQRWAMRQCSSSIASAMQGTPCMALAIGSVQCDCNCVVVCYKLFIHYFWCRIWCNGNWYWPVWPAAAAAAVYWHRPVWQHSLWSSKAHVWCSANNCKHSIRWFEHCWGWNDAVRTSQSEQGIPIALSIGCVCDWVWLQKESLRNNYSFFSFQLLVLCGRHLVLVFVVSVVIFTLSKLVDSAENVWYSCNNFMMAIVLCPWL